MLFQEPIVLKNWLPNTPPINFPAPETDAKVIIAKIADPPKNAEKSFLRCLSSEKRTAIKYASKNKTSAVKKLLGSAPVPKIAWELASENIPDKNQNKSAPAPKIKTLCAAIAIRALKIECTR